MIIPRGNGSDIDTGFGSRYLAMAQLLFELPIDCAITLDELQAINRALFVERRCDF